jgi:hypothetical protein
MENAIPESEVLVGIATPGLTLTGFSGLVAVMGRRRDGQWTAGERFQFFQLAAISLAVTFAVFVPAVASTALATETALDFIGADAFILLLNLLWMFFVATVNFVQLLNNREKS